MVTSAYAQIVRAVRPGVVLVVIPCPDEPGLEVCTGTAPQDCDAHMFEVLAIMAIQNHIENHRSHAEDDS